MSVTPEGALRAARARLARKPAGARRSAERQRAVRRSLARMEALLRAEPRAAVAWARAACALLPPGGAASADAELAWQARRGLVKALHAAGEARAALEVLGGLARWSLPPARRGDVESTRAVLLARTGRPREAARCAARARKAFASIGDRVGCAHVDVNEANVLHRQERHARALVLYRRARRMLRRAGRTADVAACDVGVGITSTFLGRLPGARRALQAAEVAFARAGASHARLVAAYNRAYVDVLDGQPQRALDGLAAARVGFGDLGDARAVVLCDLDIGEARLLLHQWPEAIVAAREAVAACGRLGLTTERARAQLHLARALAGRDGSRNGEVARLLDEARRQLETEGNVVGAATALVLLARARASAGELEDAHRLAKRAATAFSRQRVPSREGMALMTQARAMQGLGRGRAACMTARRAGRLRGVGNWVRVEASTLLAETALEAGAHRDARRFAADAMARLEALSEDVRADAARTALAHDLDAAFRAGVKAWLVGRGASASRALAIADRARRMGLADQRLGVRERRRLAAEAAAAVPERGTPPTTRGLRRASAPSRASLARGDARAPLVPSLTSAQVRRSLLPGEVHVAFTCWPTGHAPALVALVQAWDAAPRAVTIEGAALGELTARLHATAESETLLELRRHPRASAFGAATEEAARRLAAHLIDPLDDELARCRRLIVSAHGPLVGLCWSLLPWRGRPLGWSKEACVVPSAAWLRGPRRAMGRPRAFVFGVPDEAAPLAADEARAVAAAIPGARLLLGSSATAAALAKALRSPGSVVHVAAHAQFRRECPGESALRLGDGWVRAGDLAREPTRAGLVVLSACQAGALVAGDGAQFAGVARMLLRAGCRRVIGSPWSVPDELGLRLWPMVHAGISRGLAPTPALVSAQRAAAAGPFAHVAWSFTTIGRA